MRSFRFYSSFYHLLWDIEAESEEQARAQIPSIELLRGYTDPISAWELLDPDQEPGLTSRHDRLGLFLWLFTVVAEDTQAIHDVKTLARYSNEALAQVERVLGPVRITAQGKRRADDLLLAGERSLAGGGRLIPGPFDQYIRPGAIRD